jgi:hypothetical protein
MQFKRRISLHKIQNFMVGELLRSKSEDNFRGVRDHFSFAVRPHLLGPSTHSFPQNTCLSSNPSITYLPLLSGRVITASLISIGAFLCQIFPPCFFRVQTAALARALGLRRASPVTPFFVDPHSTDLIAAEKTLHRLISLYKRVGKRKRRVLKLPSDVGRYEGEGGR